MDELYRKVISDKAPLHEKVKFINTSGLFEKMLSAVKKTQNLKKLRKPFPKHDIVSLKNSNDFRHFLGKSDI